jgi:hypothetical protein
MDSLKRLIKPLSILPVGKLKLAFVKTAGAVVRA